MRTHRWIGEDGDDEGWRWASYRNATHPSFWVATTKMPEYFGGSAGNPYQKDDGHAAAGTGDQFMCAAAPAAVDDALHVACASRSESRMYVELVGKFAWISFQVPNDLRDRADAVGLAGRGQLPRGQGLLPLEGSTTAACHSLHTCACV